MKENRKKRVFNKKEFGEEFEMKMMSRGFY
jgi:hypothetical protein